jgi:ethanolamine utilization protein EutQ (cupin superfamily)
MLSTKEKMLSIISMLPEDKTEDELIEEFLTRLMLERSKEQFEQGQYLDHETVKQGLLK